ncbi:hypothetical protein [Arsenicibacter rosenii]|uniref:Uncharacterized protein n=1 Tax=Arsenicibacter rosenii TaxID=1750698 RepID=A0A1S2VAF5_9BACT|nr:hypothetical protein [Arsenicibacter rosenii]OIN55672.1 hypothetical protein BLX24_28755 [Arsenicibacter rosenii]
METENTNIEPKPKKKSYKWLLYVIGAVVLINIIGQIINSSKTSEQKARESETEIHNKLVESKEDSLTKAYIISKRVLKQSLKDPDSYEEINAEKFFVKPDLNSKTPSPYIQVVIKYRAKNSFGAFNIERRYFNFNKAMGLTETEKLD